MVANLRFRTILGSWSPTLLSRTDDLCRLLEIDARQLDWLSEPRGIGTFIGQHGSHSCNYMVKKIAKRRGGIRLLMAPRPRLRAVQTRILRELLDQLEPHPAAHGFRRGRSILSNARPHVGKKVVINCDLRDFFPSITFPRVCGLLVGLGYTVEIARALAFLCTTRLPLTRRRVLPQGAPTSPALSNLIAYGLDIRLAALAKRLGFTYTRYADDLTFSGDRVLAGALLKRVRAIVADEGLALNEKKVRTQRRGSCQRVTGLVVNREVTVNRQERRRLRAILHQAGKTGLEAQNRAKVDQFPAHLRGRIAHVAHVCARHGRPLADALSAASRRDENPS